MWFHRIIVVILIFSPSVAKAVYVDWQEKYIAANFVTTLVYEGPPLPSGESGSRSKVFEPRSTVSSNSYKTSFTRHVAMWDGLALGQADFEYGLRENGSGWATIRYAATAVSINNSTTGVTTDASVGGYGGLGASLNFKFETTENANFDYVIAHSVTPAVGSPYQRNHAGTLISRGGSAIEFSDEGQMVFGISSENGYPLSEIYQYHPLSPGRYFLGFSGAATVASAYATGTPSQRFEASGEYSVMWGFDGQFPGATPVSPVTFSPSAIYGDDETRIHNFRYRSMGGS